jgi:hypothetical protein
MSKEYYKYFPVRYAKDREHIDLFVEKILDMDLNERAFSEGLWMDFQELYNRFDPTSEYAFYDSERYISEAYLKFYKGGKFIYECPFFHRDSLQELIDINLEDDVYPDFIDYAHPIKFKDIPFPSNSFYIHFGTFKNSFIDKEKNAVLDGAFVYVWKNIVEVFLTSVNPDADYTLSNNLFENLHDPYFSYSISFGNTTYEVNEDNLETTTGKSSVVFQFRNQKYAEKYHGIGNIIQLSFEEMSNAIGDTEIEDEEVEDFFLISNTWLLIVNYLKRISEHPHNKISIDERTLYRNAEGFLLSQPQKKDLLKIIRI